MRLKAQIKSKCIKSIRTSTDACFEDALKDARFPVSGSVAGASAIRVAFVKQSSYVDLYTRPNVGTDSAPSDREVYESSNFRSGPVGLLAHFDTDFIIVKCADTLESKIWEYRLTNEATGSQETAERRNRRRSAQDEVAVDADTVDWSQYDIVICMENAVPSQVASQYPETVWATMLEWFGMPQFKRYLFKPPAGYDVFLTQLFSKLPFDSILPSSTLSWPYGLIHSSSFTDLGYSDREGRNRIVVDRNASEALESFGGDVDFRERLDVLGGMNIKQFVSIMRQAKYYTSFGTKRYLWGNGTLDTAALGALILTDRAQLINPSIVAPSCHVSDAKELVKKIECFDQNPELYAEALLEQQQRLNYFAFWRPLGGLHRFVEKQSRFASIEGKLEDLLAQVQR